MNSPLVKLSLVFIFAITVSVGPAVGKPVASPEKKPVEIHPRAVDLVIQGSVYDLNEQYRAALNAYNEALIYAPKSPSILNAVAKNYVRLRKVDSAIEMLNRSAEADPTYIETHELLAAIAFQKRDLNLAEKEFSKIIELDSTNVDAYLRLAEIYASRNELEKSAEQYETLLDLGLASSVIRFDLGRLYLSEDRYDDALRVFRNYVRDYPDHEQGYLAVGEVMVAKKDSAEALEWYKKAYEENVDFVGLRERLTLTLVALKDWNTAIEIYDEVAKRDTSDLFSRIRLGELYFARGDSAKAMEVFQTNIETYPDDWRGHFKLGDVYLFGGKPTESIPYYEKTVELKKDHAPGWLRLGQARQQLAQTDQAEESFRKAQELAPSDFATNFFLGNFLFARQQFEDAVKYLQIAVRQDPSNTAAMGSLAAAYDELGEHTKTVQLYDKALQLDPNNPVILNNYSYSLVERNERLEEALQMVRKAVEAEPENGAFLDTIGWVYYKLGEYKKALEYIKQSLSIREDSAEVLEHLGHVYEKLGETELAIQFWKKAVELEPGRADLLPQLRNN